MLEDCPQVVPDRSVSVILLAGGVGKRMGASIPKQYLELKGQPIATHSLQTLAHMREVCFVNFSLLLCLCLCALAPTSPCTQPAA